MLTVVNYFDKNKSRACAQAAQARKRGEMNACVHFLHRHFGSGKCWYTLKPVRRDAQKLAVLAKQAHTHRRSNHLGARLIAPYALRSSQIPSRATQLDSANAALAFRQCSVPQTDAGYVGNSQRGFCALFASVWLFDKLRGCCKTAPMNIFVLYAKADRKVF